MRILLAAVLLLAAPAVGGCGSQSGDAATDPGSPSHSSSPAPDGMPTQIPAAPGTVTTRGVATVLDTGHPELCFAVRESYPPQCDGPRIAGWDWGQVAKGSYEAANGTWWGEYVLTGTWDGTTFTLESAVTGPVYGHHGDRADPTPTPAAAHADPDLDRIATRLQALPGAIVVDAHDGRVVAQVVYDDGSLQDWADDTYGEDVVVITPMLVDLRG